MRSCGRACVRVYVAVPLRACAPYAGVGRYVPTRPCDIWRAIGLFIADVTAPSWRVRPLPSMRRPRFRRAAARRKVLDPVFFTALTHATEVGAAGAHRPLRRARACASATACLPGRCRAAPEVPRGICRDHMGHHHHGASAAAHRRCRSRIPWPSDPPSRKPLLQRNVYSWSLLDAFSARSLPWPS